MSLKGLVTMKSPGWKISGQMSEDVMSKAAVDKQECKEETRCICLENTATLTHRAEKFWLLKCMQASVRGHVAAHIYVHHFL